MFAQLVGLNNVGVAVDPEIINDRVLLCPVFPLVSVATTRQSYVLFDNGLADCEVHEILFQDIVVLSQLKYKS